MKSLRFHCYIKFFILYCKQRRTDVLLVMTMQTIPTAQQTRQWITPAQAFGCLVDVKQEADNDLVRSMNHWFVTLHRTRLSAVILLFSEYYNNMSGVQEQAVCIKPLIRQMYFSAISVSSLDRNAYSASDLRSYMVLWVIKLSSFVGGLKFSDESAASIFLVKRTNHVPSSHEGPPYPQPSCFSPQHGAWTCTLLQLYYTFQSSCQGTRFIYSLLPQLFTLFTQIRIRHDNLFAKYKLTGF